MPNDICLRHPDATPARSHLGRFCPECLRESFAGHAAVENATDKYFDAISDVVEAHPISGHRKGGAGEPS